MLTKQIDINIMLITSGQLVNFISHDINKILIRGDKYE